jgi:hypothetical protein
VPRTILKTSGSEKLTRAQREQLFFGYHVLDAPDLQRFDRSLTPGPEGRAAWAKLRRPLIEQFITLRPDSRQQCFGPGCRPFAFWCWDTPQLPGWAHSRRWPTPALHEQFEHLKATHQLLPGEEQAMEQVHSVLKPDQAPITGEEIAEAVKTMKDWGRYPDENREHLTLQIQEDRWAAEWHRQRGRSAIAAGYTARADALEKMRATRAPNPEPEGKKGTEVIQ